jgi:hypothetical protein
VSDYTVNYRPVFSSERTYWKQNNVNCQMKAAQDTVWSRVPKGGPIPRLTGRLTVGRKKNSNSNYILFKVLQLNIDIMWLQCYHASLCEENHLNAGYIFLHELLQYNNSWPHINWSKCHSHMAILQTNSMVWVRERTILTERPPLVGEAITNLCR